MAITIEQEPEDYSAGYSAVPLRVSSDNIDLEELKYLINITYDEYTVNSASVTSINGRPATLIDFTTDHGYSVGDKVLFYNPNTPDYSGVYNILSIPNADEIVIDLVQGSPISLVTTSYFYRIIPYAMLPDTNGEAKLDLSNTLKDFVTYNFDATDEIIEGTDTFLDYGLTIGEEYKYVFEFEDNFFITGGKVGFNNTTGTLADVNASPFKIGDQINIVQDLYQWDYDTTTTTGGNLTFVSATTDHGFSVDDLVNTSGEITNPSYNGTTTVLSAPTTKSIEVNKAYVSATAEPGEVLGVITPTYNTVATITDIYYDVSLGYAIETDIDYTVATPPIGGKIKFADDRVTQDYIDARVTGKKVFNAGFTKSEYGFNNGDFDTYTIQLRGKDFNNLSTILAKGIASEYRIELDSKSWLLARTIGLGASKCSAYISAYDVNDVFLSLTRINNFSLYDEFYFPVGIDQVINNSNTTLVGGSALSAIKDDIAYYDVEAERLGSDYSNSIRFYINTDCSSYEVYHLCWKDAFGSFISYPFKYIEKPSTEFERKTYYQKEGRFDRTANNFGYDSYGRGETGYYNRSRDKKILNSGWVTEEENEIIKDLLGSRVVFLQEPDGTMRACTLTTTSQEFGKKDTTNLWKFEFEVRLANNEFRA